VIQPILHMGDPRLLERSRAVERFGTERLQNLTRDEIESRFRIFRELTHLE